ncbi:MAG: hemolysin family protein [Polyangiales bacterium]
MGPLLTALGVSLAFILFGAFFAGIEAALLALPEARLLALRDELGDHNPHLSRYLEDPAPTLSRLLAGRVLSPVAATALATRAVLADQARTWEIVVVVLGIALTYGLLTEFAVTVGRRWARVIAPRALRFARPVTALLAPIAAPMLLLARWASRRMAVRRPSEPPSMTEREVEYVVEAAQESGAVDPVSSQMLQNVFDVKQRTAREIMVPRTQIVALDAETPFDDAVRRLADEGHSRVPLYRGAIDNVVGVLVAKDVFRLATQGGDGRRSLAEVARKPVVVVDTQPVLSVLRELQSDRTHLAVVVDEFGALVGLVTLEDILEEIVGEIEDEHDTQGEERDLVPLSDGRWIARASMDVESLGESLGIEFPENGDYRSLGGFLGARSGKVPVPGTVVIWAGYSFVVREGDKRRATKVEIVREARRSDHAPVSADLSA